MEFLSWDRAEGVADSVQSFQDLEGQSSTKEVGMRMVDIELPSSTGASASMPLGRPVLLIHQQIHCCLAQLPIWAFAFAAPVLLSGTQELTCCSTPG